MAEGEVKEINMAEANMPSGSEESDTDDGSTTCSETDDKDNELNEEELNELNNLYFQRAADHAKKHLGAKLDEATTLRIYGLYKQAMFGKCNTSKPYFFNFVEKSKWNAWNSLGSLDQGTAKFMYIQQVKDLDPGFNETKASDGKSSDVGSGGLGVSVSKMADSGSVDDIVADDKKTLFDWCKEGNAIQLRNCLLKNRQQQLPRDSSSTSVPNCKDGDRHQASENQLITSQITTSPEEGRNSSSTGRRDSFSLLSTCDENGMTLLHWASDRGHVEVVRLLLELGADVNCRDSDRQTALHYAASCEHPEVIRELVKAGCDATAKDDCGCTAEQATESGDIRLLMHQLTSAENQRAT